MTLERLPPVSGMPFRLMHGRQLPAAEYLIQKHVYPVTTAFPARLSNRMCSNSLFSTTKRISATERTGAAGTIETSCQEKEIGDHIPPA